MTINANSSEYKSPVGLDNLYVAEVTQDDATAYVADTPEYLAPAAEASQEPSTSFEVQYADNQPFDVHTAEGDTKVNLKVTAMPAEMLAKITGKVFDAASGRVFDNGGTPPDMALSFRALKSNGSQRYYQYLKGKFSTPKDEATTKGEKPEPKTTELVYTAIRTVHKWDLGDVTESVKRIFGDEDTTNFSGTTWFNAVQVPSLSSPSALARSSSSPTDGVTGVSVSANLSLTFNNALANDAVDRVVLLKASDGTRVAGEITLDVTKKIIGMNPTSDLSALTEYIFAYAVVDIYGQTLSGAINFTTA